MLRLRNDKSGVVVIVREDTAARLGSAWVPVEEETPKPAPTRRNRSKKKSS